MRSLPTGQVVFLDFPMVSRVAPAVGRLEDVAHHGTPIEAWAARIS